MEFSSIIIISIVQGLTEFLPVSSSGHLVLVPLIFNMPDQKLVMDLAVHIGTLLAVLVYYRRDVWEISLSCLPWKKTFHKDKRRLGIYIILATIPAIIFGFIMHNILPEGIRDVRVIAATTLGFGVLLGVADYTGSRTGTIEQITLKSAMLIGFAQVLALIPGTSRSGITITMARFLGISRVDAARFSFLLSIPVTAGAGFLGVLDVLKSHDAQLGMDMLLAVFVTLVAGFLAIAFMMRWLKNSGMMPFAIYRVIMGAILAVYLVF
ncbi:MAG: undecaprenyl-diphosphate phosphatase [Alphaproteobacteria bacterium]|nr:undecaprenyl-diphosphate phosphatase [Alphaproteobacteria bacterium]